mmetsp:Transcript_95449/g.172238  ORF Transcript_95449/g.172238 Transcript_95449/m.172238 type:complete len:751 (+) Transcript_95449:81-2333(+)
MVYWDSSRLRAVIPVGRRRGAVLCSHAGREAYVRISRCSFVAALAVALLLVLAHRLGNSVPPSMGTAMAAPNAGAARSARLARASAAGASSFHELKVDQLKVLLRDLNMAVTGNKAELVGRLVKSEAASAKGKVVKIKKAEAKPKSAPVKMPLTDGHDDHKEVGRLVMSEAASAQGKVVKIEKAEAKPKLSTSRKLVSRPLVNKRKSVPVETLLEDEEEEDEGDSDEDFLHRQELFRQVEKLSDTRQGRHPSSVKVQEWVQKRVGQWQSLEVASKRPKAQEVEVEERLADFFKNFPEMKEKMRESQIEGVKMSIRRDGRCLVADEMGLGKTLQALVIAQCYAEEWPVLIVAPTSVVLNWKTEVVKWFPHLSSEIQVLEWKTFNGHPRREKLVYLVSYDQLMAHKEFRTRPDGNPYKVVIVDEAHMMKNPDARRTKALIPICRTASRCSLLTGTPVLNCAAETWVHMAALDESIPGFADFCVRYSLFKQLEKTADERPELTPVGVREPEELHELLQSFMVRRTKQDVMPDLAEKRRHVKIFQGEDLEGKYLRAIIARQKAAGGKNFANYASMVFSVTAKAKKEAVAKYVEEIIQQQSDAKIVVFGHHEIILSAVEKKLKRLGLSYIRVDGQVSMSDRQERVDAFQNSDEIRVALVGIMACGQGISLTAARVAIFAELYWVPARLLQAEDRVHRHGQKNIVDIYYCVAQGGSYMDESILKKIVDKEMLGDMIVDGKKRNQTSSNFKALLDAK